MDDIDLALQAALNRLDPAELRRRLLRGAPSAILRPIRPWCLCLRASDTRISDPGDLAYNHFPHDVILCSDTLRRLTRPVVLDWPGVDWTTAARRLGRHPESLRAWIKRGRFVATRFNARALGKRGKPVPLIWARSPLDPNADAAAPPNSIWGTLWQYHHARIPDDLEFTLRRVPRIRPHAADRRLLPGRFRGWSFVCPGLSPLAPCGRIVERLFIPLTPTTLFDALSLPSSLAPDAPTPTPTPAPARPAPRVAPFPFAPACHRCHRIRYDSLTSRQDWNQFVRIISGGLLFGREVPPPESLKPRRKRPYVTHPRPTPRQDRVRDLLLTTLPVDTIAARLGVKRSTIYAHAKRIYRDANLHSRQQLRLAAGIPNPPKPPRRRKRNAQPNKR